MKLKILLVIIVIISSSLVVNYYISENNKEELINNKINELTEYQNKEVQKNITKSENLDKIISESTVIVISARKTGTGFIYDDKIITANHIIDDKDNIYLENSNGEVINGEFVTKNQALDLAIIKPNKKINRTTKFNNAKIGEKVWLSGNPGGSGITYRKGEITGKDNLIKYNDIIVPSYLKIKPEVKKGYSGGAIFDKSGSIVGIIRGKRDRQTFALSTELIEDFIQDTEKYDNYKYYTTKKRIVSAKMNINEKIVKGIKIKENPRVIIKIEDERIKNPSKAYTEILDETNPKKSSINISILNKNGEVEKEKLELTATNP